jgi:diphosphomevalonate decarboxylase
MNGVYRATVASNIAFLKYWGKRDARLQWPANDSFSMTLSRLCSTTEARPIQASDHRFVFAGQAFSRAEKRFAKTFQQLDDLTQTFVPMGAGIASSASGLAALTLASLAAWLKAPDWQSLAAKGFSLSRIANLARQGSGSAGRSLFGGYVAWRAGDHPEQQTIEPLFPAEHWDLHDTIVLFSKGEKSLSSTEAHAHAWSSPLFRTRLAGLPERLAAMENAMTHCNFEQLGPLLEMEALEMHAVTMTATPSHCYLTSDAWNFQASIREARRRGEVHAYFTIDAGPNIHLIHEASEHEQLKRWLEERFNPQELLHDRVGQGPQLSFLSE